MKVKMEEKNKKLSREEIAIIEVGETNISYKNQKILIIFFLLFISIAPVIQLIIPRVNNNNLEYIVSNNTQQADSLYSVFDKFSAYNSYLQTKLENFENNLEDNSVYREAIIPITQAGLFKIFTTGNENAWIGDEYLYYKDANSYLTQPGFLEKEQLEKRQKEASIQPNPINAIIDFKNQLAKRGIKLIIVPAPPKASFVLRNGNDVLNNESYNKFVIKLKKEGVIVCDLFKLLENRNFENSGFLKYDTHWSPETIKVVSEEVSKLLDSLSIQKGKTDYLTKKIEIQNYGDIVDMLNLNNNSHFFKPQTIEIEQVLENNFLFKPSKQSDILFLGDSYSNIYSMETMNWGASAGLSEHISKKMHRPIDRIIMNDAGAYATRQELSNDMKRGRDRLYNKKVVIWEFAARELSVGEWKILDMEVDEKYTSQFFIPEKNSSYFVTGIVKETSSIPIPGSVPYKDHITSVHISNLKNIHNQNELGEAIVYLSSMEDNKWTNAARLRNGQKIKLNIYNWYDYSNKYGSINRSELQDDELSLEEPCWGVLIK